ncbi:MAG: uroporphyrinogen decarboxylase [Nitrospiraceae bacterium]|nr:MAG: uroporphyrinogen decarboxylase [Nitrospiraceae bacterium]
MNDTFLKACRGEAVPYTPIWIMRQAGRYLEEYRAVRGKADFLTMCKTPELTTEVTLQPIDILNVDAAILFCDILIPCEAMGQGLEFHEGKGPILFPEIRDEETVNKLFVPDPEDTMKFVMDAIRMLRKELSDRVPLIGFAGAPLTTATYMIEGGTSKNFLNTKRMIFEAPDLYSTFMDKVTATITEYLKAQISAGAQAVQIFDTWGGIFSPEDFREYALRYVQIIIKDLKSAMASGSINQVPLIYFVGETAGLLEEIKTSGADVHGVDWRINLDDAISRLGDGAVVQGNLDPLSMFLPQDKIEERVKDVLKRAASAKGHIFNLGHGVVPQTPRDNVIALVEMVHRLSKK